MILNPYDLTVGVFIRGLTNLKMQLAKAKDHADAQGIPEAVLLAARIDANGSDTGYAPMDLHGYTLAAQVHWAAEGAKMAIARIVGEQLAPAVNEAKTIEDLEHHIDAAVAYFQEIAPAGLESGLDRMIEHPRASTRSSGSHFMLAFAIPHFFYHVTTAYGILRNQGVPLRMGDFLGDWGKG